MIPMADGAKKACSYFHHGRDANQSPEAWHGELLQNELKKGEVMMCTLAAASVSVRDSKGGNPRARTRNVLLGCICPSASTMQFSAQTRYGDFHPVCLWCQLSPSPMSSNWRVVWMNANCRWITLQLGMSLCVSDVRRGVVPVPQDHSQRKFQPIYKTLLIHVQHHVI